MGAIVRNAAYGIIGELALWGALLPMGILALVLLIYILAASWREWRHAT